jgi:hypothetical protein
VARHRRQQVLRLKTSDKPGSPGEFRKIQFTVKQKGITVRAREGCYTAWPPAIDNSLCRVVSPALHRSPSTSSSLERLRMNPYTPDLPSAVKTTFGVLCITPLGSDGASSYIFSRRPVSMSTL